MDDTLGDSLMVKAMDLPHVNDFLVFGSWLSPTYSFSSNLILQAVVANAVVIRGLKPVVEVRNFDTIIGSSVLLAVGILGIALQIRHFLIR